MLIQISNRCDEGCPHCLQDSREDGGLMSLETFKSAVRFGCETGWHLFLITGGEPTMNPDMERMLRWFDKAKSFIGSQHELRRGGFSD